MKSQDFKTHLEDLLLHAERIGFSAVEIRAGELHRRVGGYPGSDHRLSSCCSVMRQAMREGDQLLEETPSGVGANVLFRYRLPR